MHYSCIACITTDSVMRMEKKNYPQMPKSIEVELELESESELNLTLN